MELCLVFWIISYMLLLIIEKILFEYDVLKPIDEKQINNNIVRDIKLITDFVNELNLDNDLFKKEV